MKENKDSADKASGKKTDVAAQLKAADPKQSKDGKNSKLAKKLSKKKHPRCHSWGMGVYVFLCIFAFFFLLAVAIVAGIYGDKMTNFNSIDKVKDKGDEWLDTFESKLTKQVLNLAEKYPKTWNNTQAAIGCCGWNFAKEDDTTTTSGNGKTTTTVSTTTNATTATTKGTGATTKSTTTTTKAATEAPVKVGILTGNTNSKCCQNRNVVTSVNIIGKVNLDVGGCRKGDSDNVYTCEGVVATHIQGNLVKTSICSAVLSIVQLALAICGCVVRYPKLFAYCNCKKKGAKGEKVDPEVTQVQPISGSII